MNKKGMVVNKRFVIALLLVACVSMPLLSQITPVNFFEPYERIMKSESWQGTVLKAGVFVEDTTAGHSRDIEEDKVDVLRIYSGTESSLAMLMGALPGTPLHTFANNLLGALGTATDDNSRGRFALNGTFFQTAVTPYVRLRITDDLFTGMLEFGAWLPIKENGVNNVRRCDLTKMELNADLLVKQTLTNRIDEVVQEFGCLQLCDTSHSGLGDLLLLCRWMRDFSRVRRRLKNVRIILQAGLSIPTGVEKDVDQAFSWALGYDGAWGLHVGGHIDIDFSEYLRGGLAVNFLSLFDHTKVRRMKTDPNQTDFFLLHKGEATKCFGPTWKFKIFLQFQEFIRGMSLITEYQFLKHEHDTLYPQSDFFTHAIVNSAERLQEWDSHYMRFGWTFDTGLRWPQWFVKPYVSLFYKLPLSGLRSIAAHTYGGEIGFAF